MVNSRVCPTFHRFSFCCLQEFYIISMVTSCIATTSSQTREVGREDDRDRSTPTWLTIFRALVNNRMTNQPGMSSCVTKREEL
ncbi:hypothetical protein GBAR_LOCUS30529, partial [Geodia barretti]